MHILNRQPKEPLTQKKLNPKKPKENFLKSNFYILQIATMCRRKKSIYVETKWLKNNERNCSCTIRDSLY